MNKTEKLYKITYIEKGQPFDYKRIDKTKTFIAIDYQLWQNCHLFKVNQFEYKTIANEDILSIECL